MLRSSWLGISLIVLAPVIPIASYCLGVITNLSSLVENILGAIVVGMFTTGCAFLYYGPRANEQEILRKERVWKAIQAWVALPITDFRHQQDTLPLAEKPPELADEVHECLRKKYPAIWTNLQKLRQEYREWKNEHVSDRFTERINGVPTIHINMVHSYNESICRRLKELHDQLKERIKSDILAKDHTRLKC